MKGQESAKRALEIAAAGAHNLLMVGPPGSGKSMLAARLPGILPPLEPSEALELGMIQSVAGGLRGGGLLRERPFRDPHHSASLPALVGGGLRTRPGEISLAHCGVLFLDELPEFNRAALEALRQPLETGRVSVARANSHVTYPARVQLIAAMNPCRCGYLSEPGRACGRAPRCALDYQSRLSGPLLDRIDLHIDVPPVSAADLALPPPAETSAEVMRRVAAARTRQRERYARLPEDRRIRTNAEADGTLLDEVATPEPAGLALLTRATERLRLRPAAIIACCGWRARWPISMPPRGLLAGISPKRSRIARRSTRRNAPGASGKSPARPRRSLAATMDGAPEAAYPCTPSALQLISCPRLNGLVSCT